ncbi:enoyl-CoA hydratase [Muricoccus radiodurans]|uniref:enoyl-CoA hydratase n=1 Tax=Muricoccus radiodurans TaxID=2231721 RepID=UPI003CFAA23B
MDGMTPAAQKILARKEDGIGWLTFNQPEKRNAISIEMWDMIGAALSDFSADPDVRVVVMHGAGGKAFAAGADISQFEKVRSDAAAQEEYGRRSGVGREAMGALQKPLIAMIQGFCIGGGMAIALRADIRVASSDSQFAIPAAKLSIAYQYDALQRLVALTGPAVAKEIMFTARRYTAAQALAMRLINTVVEPEELESTVRALAAEMGANAPLSIRASKASIDQIAGDPALRNREAIAALERACFDSADYAEGRRAFMEKRKPVFQGR